MHVLLLLHSVTQDAQDKFVVPLWWVSVSTTLTTIFKANITFERDQMQLESTIVDEERIWHRSASLLAALQVSALEALTSIYKYQLNSTKNCQDLLNFDCIENGIIFGSLVGSASSCISMMLQYDDGHIQFAAAKAFHQFASTIIPLEESDPNLRTRPENISFCNTICTHVDVMIEEVFEVLKKEKETKICFIDLLTIRLMLDVLVTFSNNSIGPQIQIYLMQALQGSPGSQDKTSQDKTSQDKSGASGDGLLEGGEYADRRREEYVRALLRYSERNYVQSLQLIAHTAPSSYNNVVEACSGNIQLLHQTTSSFHAASLDEPTQGKACSATSFASAPKVWTVWQRHIPSPVVTSPPSPHVLPSLSQFSPDQLTSFDAVSSSASTEQQPLVPATDTPPRGDLSDNVQPPPSRSLSSEASFSSSFSSSSLPQQHQQQITPPPELRRAASSEPRGLGSPRKSPSRTLSKFSLGNISQTFSSSFSSSIDSYDGIQTVSKESISFLIREVFSGICLKNGLLQNDSIDVQGRILMTSKVNKEVSVEVGMNLNHPNVFSGVTQRLCDTETVNAYAITTEKALVRKVDPRGSIVVLASPEQNSNAEQEVLQYNLKYKACPLKVVSSCSCLEDNTGTEVFTVIIHQKYENISDIVDICDLYVNIDLPSNDSVINCDVMADNQMKFTLNADKQGCVCKFTKLKRHKVSILHVKIQMKGVNVNRFNSLDKQLQGGVSPNTHDSSGDEMALNNAKVKFVVVPPKKSNSPNISVLSGFNLRFIKVLDKTAKISKTISFEVALQAFEASFRDCAHTTRLKEGTTAEEEVCACVFMSYSCCILSISFSNVMS
jgi:hypothetical protein